MAYDNFSPDQLELIDLIRNELADFVDSQPKNLWANSDIYQQHFEYVAGQLEHLQRAADMVGLAGFARSCQIMAATFKDASAGEPITDSHQQQWVVRWPIVLLAYLQSLLAKGFYLETGRELIEFMVDERWPLCLSPKDASDLSDAFAQSEVVVDSGHPPLYPSQVNAELASLAIPDDVRPELLASLKIELPQQAEAFSASVEHYIHTHDASYLLTAQRIAHTIKGASHVVGIVGIGNLMHYCEDLLETHQKGVDVGGDGLVDLLQESADCLASISDHLQGFSPAPDNVAEILRSLLKALHGDAAVNDSDAVDTSLTEQSVSTLQSFTPSMDRDQLFTENDDDEFSLFDEESLQIIDELISGKGDPLSDADMKLASNLTAEPPCIELQPQSLVDELSQDDMQPSFNLAIADNVASDLLRVAGELQISNTQVAARVESTKDIIASALRFHKQLLSLADDLDKRLARQSAMAVASHSGDGSVMDPLELERYNELHSFSSRLQEVTTDASEAAADAEQSLVELKNIVTQQRQLGFEMQDKVLGIRMLPASVLTSRFARAVRQASRLTQKNATFDVLGDDVLLDSRVINAIADPILHLLRNAVDHGLEANAKAREQVGKSREGRILLKFDRVGESVRIQVRDDGSGLNYPAIRATAIDRGLLDFDDQAEPRELERLLLVPGFSTRTQVTQTSGRGIGLDAVNDQIRQLKGVLTIDSQEGQGTCFEMQVPMSVLSAHLLMVSSQGKPFGVVSRGLEQIAYLQKGDLKTSDNYYSYMLGDESIPVKFLEDLLTEGQESLFDSQTHYSALLVTQDVLGQKVGIAVENIVASEDHVVKPLGQYCFKPLGVTGAVILGDGEIAPVIDIHELPSIGMVEQERERWLKGAALAKTIKNERLIAQPVALVADDSLSARRALAQFMSDMGYEVLSARDGFDAIQLMADKTPEIALIDLEMPRMNGLELATHMRGQERLADTPIVMITSRTTARHKLLAENAGVDSYLNKPWKDDDLTTIIEQLLPMSCAV